jgi:3,4-dihydroxy 2-butanone 4-phosphate synthase / GTP cyclohydrolase II
MPVATIEAGLEDLRAGRMVILVDDEDRENEGDLCLAAEKVTPEAINFMAREGRGLICLAMTEQRLEALDLPLIVEQPANSSLFGTAFSVPIDARVGVSTGISAADRATTIRVAVDDRTRPGDLVRPGHVHTLRARQGGVLVRTGQTEGSVDLARLAGLKPAAVICEVMNEDGTMARMPDLERFAERHGLRILTIRDLVEFRMRNERLVHRAAVTELPTRFGGLFTAIAYTSDVDPHPHLALVKGTIDPAEPTLVRVHSECLTGDVLGSERCDCGEQLQAAMGMIEREGRGVLLYMRQEGRGIGLLNKLKAYSLQDGGLDTVQANLDLGFKADLRHYGVGAQILVDLGVRKMRLLTNNPKKVVGLEGYGLEIVERVAIEMPPRAANRGYLVTKKTKLGHLLTLEEAETGGPR